MKKQKKMLAVLVSLIFIFCMGCGKTQSGENVGETVEASAETGTVMEASAETTGEDGVGNAGTIKIGISAWTGWYPWMIADEKGFFEENGVNAEVVYFPVYSDQFQAYASGNLDLVSISLCDMVPPVSNGVDVVGFLVNDNSFGGDCIVATNGVKSVEELKGKTIAVEIGCLSHYLALNALENAGLDEADVNFTNMTMADASTALISGQIDAAAICEPYVSLAEKEGDVTKVFSTKETPGLIPDLTAASPEFLASHKEEIVKITKAWYQTLAYMEDNKEECIGIMADAAGTSEEEFEKMLDGIKLFSMDDNVEAFAEGDDFTHLNYTLQKNAEFLKDQDVVSDISMIDGSLLDDSIIRELSE